jgi:hypothetical protein
MTTPTGSNNDDGTEPIPPSSSGQPRPSTPPPSTPPPSTYPSTPGYPTSPSSSGYPPSPSGQPYSTAPGSGYVPPQPVQQQAGTNVMAILALVGAFIFAPLGIVFGYIAKRQIKETGEQGEGLANVGLILGYVFTGLAVLGCCIGLIAIIAAGNNTT